MSGFETLLSDPSFAFLREQWHAESAVKIHKRGGRKQAGEMTGSFFRILNDQFIRWLPVIDDEGVVTFTHRAPRTMDEPDEFVMPAHEALKREKPDASVVGRRGEPEYRWLRETIAWRYLPCMCNCADVVAHIAQRDRTTVDNVITNVRAASRRALFFLAAHDALPADVAGGIKTAPMRGYRRESPPPTSREIAALPRVFWPCGCTELALADDCEQHRASSATAA